MKINEACLIKLDCVSWLTMKLSIVTEPSFETVKSSLNKSSHLLKSDLKSFVLKQFALKFDQFYLNFETNRSFFPVLKTVLYKNSRPKLQHSTINKSFSLFVRFSSLLKLLSFQILIEIVFFFLFSKIFYFEIEKKNSKILLWKFWLNCK